MSARAALPLAAVLVLAGCGSQRGPVADPGTDEPVASTPSDDGRVRGWTTVLDDGDGPELCLGGVLESLPPQCGGPAVVGWDWAEVSGFEDVRGTRWGSYVVTGTYDGDRFTLTEQPVPSEEYDGPPAPYSPDTDLTTPCPQPEGGWHPVDPALTTDRTLDRVVGVAASLDGYGELWLDQSVNPAYGSDDPEVVESELNDPARLVVNVRVTGDPAVAEERLREVWGGALCVTRALRTDAELARIQRAVGDVPGMLETSRGRDVVDLRVVFDDGSLQRQLDDEYGAGVVVVTSALVPLPDLG